MFDRVVLAALAASLLVGCSGSTGEPGRITFQLRLVGLPPVAPEQGHYEGFAVQGGTPRSTGKFRLDTSATPALVVSLNGQVVYGSVDSAQFGPSSTLLGEDFPLIWQSSEFFVTLEPADDTDGVPSGNRVISGPIVGDRALLASAFAPGPGLAAANASAILAAPTAGPAPSVAGLWFVASSALPIPTLGLPVLSGDWRYEAFLLLGADVSVSLGAFRDPSARDFDAHTAATRGDVGPGFEAPGQDFVRAAVLGSASRLDLATGTFRVRVTVEPEPDTSSRPSPFVVLEGPVPATLVTSGNASVGDSVLPQVSTLPSLTAQASSASITFTGSLPGSFGPAVAGPLADPRDGHYALFAVLAGQPLFLGALAVDSSDAVFALATGAVLGTRQMFQVDAVSLGLTGGLPDPGILDALILSIEPEGPDRASPTAEILRGTVLAGQAELVPSVTLGPPSAPFGTFVTRFSLRTPTNDDGVTPADDHRGLWFVDASGLPSLALPPLSPGLSYEAFVEDTSTGDVWSLGRFDRGDRADADATSFPGRGASGFGFATPGQDFVRDVAGLALPGPFPVSGQLVVVTVEPFPDSSPSPSPFVVSMGFAPNAPEVPFALANTAPILSGELRFEP